MDIVLAAKGRTWKVLIERLDMASRCFKTHVSHTIPVGFPLSSHTERVVGPSLSFSGRYVAPHPTKEGWCEPQRLVFTERSGWLRVSDRFMSRISVA